MIYSFSAYYSYNFFFNGKQLFLESTEKGTDRKHNQGFLQEQCKNGGGRRQHHRTKINPSLYNKKMVGGEENLQ